VDGAYTPTTQNILQTAHFVMKGGHPVPLCAVNEQSLISQWTFHEHSMNIVLAVANEFSCVNVGFEHLGEGNKFGPSLIQLIQTPEVSSILSDCGGYPPLMPFFIGEMSLNGIGGVRQERVLKCAVHVAIQTSSALLQSFTPASKNLL
jgi:hypothetical protein